MIVNIINRMFNVKERLQRYTNDCNNINRINVINRINTWCWLYKGTSLVYLAMHPSVLSILGYKRGYRADSFLVILGEATHTAMHGQILVPNSSNMLTLCLWTAG